MSAKYKSPSFLLPNELNTSTNPSLSADRASNYSMYINTVGEGITTGSLTDLGISTTFSFSIWVNLSAFASSYMHVLSTGFFNTPGFALWVKQDSGNYYWSFYVNGYTTNVITDTTAIVLNQWYHIAVSWDNTTGAKMYINGGSPITGLSGITLGNLSKNIAIGAAFNNTFQYPINGQIDEVAVFNRALNTTEIAALYDGTGSNIRPSNLIASNLNPVAYYPLGEQAQMQGYLGNEASSEWQFPNGVLQDYVMDFDGSDNINSEANISSVNSFTASVWINRDDSATQYIYGQWVDGTTASQSWVIQTVGGIVYFNVRDASLAAKSAISTTSLTTGVWYNIIAVWTGSNIKLYINNSLEDTTACSSMNNPSTAVKLAIGSSSNNVSPFNGKISNAVIWNSDQESNKDNIYNNGSPQTTYTVTPQNWWKLNATSIYTPSAPNYTTALDFGGTSDYFDAGNINGIEVSDFTVSLWVKFDGNQNSMIFFSGTSLSTNSTYVQRSNNDLYFGLGAQSNYIQSTPTIANNVWHHIVVVATGTSGKIYLNGSDTSASGAALSSTRTNLGQNFTIGKGLQTNGSNGFFVDGSISNVAIYNSALTATQISTLFNFGTPETAISFSPQAWWKLDNTTTGIQDSSGNGNNGTNNGATQVNTSVAVVPSWKIPTALTIPTINTTSALYFNPAGNKISLNPKFNFDLTSVNTISVWVNLESYSSFNSILTNNGTGGGSTGTYTQLLVLTTGSVNNTFAFYTYTQGYSTPSANSGWRSNDIPKQEFENSWHHVMLVRDGQDVSWYYDGQPWGGGTITTTQTENVDVNSIGQGNASAGVVGKISNLAIWNSDQSSNVSNIYNNGQPQSSYTVTPNHLFNLDNLTTGINDVYSSSAGTASSGVTKVDTNVYVGNIPVNGVSTTLPSTALQQSDLQFDSPYSNYSLTFDGTGDYIDLGSASYLNGLSKFSISCWFKLDTAANNNTIISDWLYNQAGGKFALQTTDSSGSDFALLMFIRNSSSDAGNNTAKTSRILTEGNWYNVIFSFNSGSCQFYINGSPVTTTITGTIPSNLINENGNLYIGKFGGNLTRYWNGKLDETSIFNTELTSAQVLEIYNNGRPKDLTTFSGTAPTNWWRLGENAYFDNNSFVVPNSISGAPNGTGSGTITTMISADAPGTYANGIGTNLDIVDRVGDAPLSTSNSQSYNMIPDDKIPYVPGYVGNQIANNFSMTFDGVDDYFTTGSTFSTFDGLNKLSISMWVKWDNVTSFRILASLTRNSTQTNFVWMLCNINNHLRFFGSTTSEYCYSNYVLTANTWTHVSVVVDKTQSTQANKCRIFINGVDETWAGYSSFNANPLETSNSPLYIGENQNGYHNPMLGEIDEVAIFDTALNAGQIYNDIYNASLPLSSNKTADLANNPNLPTPVAWYRMGD